MRVGGRKKEMDMILGLKVLTTFEKTYSIW
jgi:hypothetical protein